MAIVIVLAIVLLLVLILLAELYCSLFLRRRKIKAGKPDSNPENPASQPQQPLEQLVPSPLSSFYAQGVLDAPRSFLFPKLPSKRENRAESDDIERPKHGKLHQFLRVQSPQQIGLASTLSHSPSPSFIPVITPHQQSDENPEIVPEDGKEKNFMYISNPIYDNEVARPSRVATPFETPDSSPSQLDRSGSSGDDEEERDDENLGTSSSPSSLPLSPMKELPAKAASVSLRDARSLGPSASESNSHIGRSSSSSDSPRTSPSW
ncbi:uncharacterized protein LOC110691097 [Chenopodium quinoa]|uniref:uncharacterized protein LOC110691097 n=1 Tax=Chenopodium quinoa TaxID=63459 RepID=UPI000B78927D|nr:uncharacterized protein LOC110691097 [Chenopodium quinoa]